MEAIADFPAKLKPLFKPRRYKVLHGGRGGAKSWGVARALLIMGASKPLRILCTREVQKSMRDSVHRLLTDQIRAMSLESVYSVFDNEIRGRNGTLFIFSGLATHTVDSIKSYEGVDIVWAEEAHGISKKSWDTLIPTIRKDGSEIWMTLNPEMDTDETYVRFVETNDPDVLVIEVNWRDNPWFPNELEKERQRAKLRDIDEYEHIWEGKPRRVASGAIYRHEIQRVYADGRVRDVPYDPLLLTHTVWDLGWNDAMTVGFVQRTGAEIRIIDYIEDSNRTLDWYVKEIERRDYRWGTDYIPHDGRARNYQTGKSTEEALRDMGRKVAVIPQSSIEEGIRQARMIWPRCYFDRTKTGRLLECLKRYRRDTNERTGEASGPLHDEYSHGADMFRYTGQASDLMSNAANDSSFQKFKERKRSWR